VAAEFASHVSAQQRLAVLSRQEMQLHLFHVKQVPLQRGGARFSAGAWEGAALVLATALWLG
jgi:hypothetical protein